MVSNQHLLQTNSSINMHTTIEHLCLFCQFHMFFSSPYHPIILQVEEEETIEGTKLFLAINEVKHCDQPLKKKQLQTGKKNSYYIKWWTKARQRNQKAAPETQSARIHTIPKDNQRATNTSGVIQMKKVCQGAHQVKNWPPSLLLAMGFWFP